MKKTFSHSKYGNITYNETFWLGKKSISVKGRQLNKIDKVTFSGKLNGPEEDVYVTVKGNILKGVKLNIDNEEIEIYPKLKPYEIIMALIPFILILIWGNSNALCSLGGAISGLFSALMVVFLRKVDKLYLKIAICVVITLITFLICFLIGLGIIASMQTSS